MNVRLTAKQRLTEKEQKELDKYIFKKAMEIYKGESMELMRRCYKIMAVALNEMFGFGKSRIMKLFDRAKDLATEREHDEIYWQHIDDTLIDQMGLEFERENYQELEE